MSLIRVHRKLPKPPWPVDDFIKERRPSGLARRIVCVHIVYLNAKDGRVVVNLHRGNFIRAMPRHNRQGPKDKPAPSFYPAVYNIEAEHIPVVLDSGTRSVTAIT